MSNIEVPNVHPFVIQWGYILLYIMIFCLHIYMYIWLMISCIYTYLLYTHGSYCSYCPRFFKMINHHTCAGVCIYTCSWGPSLSKSYCCNSTRNSSLLVPPAAHALCTASGTLIRPLGFRSHKRRNRASTLAYFRKASLSSSVSPSSSAGGASAGT